MPDASASRAPGRGVPTADRAKTTPIRVLIVLPTLSGGAGRVAIELCQALGKENVETAVFLSLGSGELVAEAKSKGIKLFEYHQGNGAGAVRALLLVPSLVARLSRRARHYDVLIGGGDATDHLPALVVGRLVKKPVVGLSQVTQSATIESYRGLGRRLMSLSTRIALPRLDATISVAEAVREDIIGLGAGRERAYVVSNGIPIARVQALSGAEKIAFARPTIAGFGRLSFEKGFDVLIRAHAIARKEIAHDLVIVGDGRERANLEQLAAELGVEDSVIFAGYRANPYPWIAAAALVCLPSRHEASPLIVLEALALCRPVIATDCPGGTRESLGDGRFGRLVPCEDPKALAEAFVEHLQTPKELQARAAAGQIEVTKNRDVATAATRYAEILREVLDRYRQGRRRALRRRPRAGAER